MSGGDWSRASSLGLGSASGEWAGVSGLGSASGEWAGVSGLMLTEGLWSEDSSRSSGTLPSAPPSETRSPAALSPFPPPLPREEGAGSSRATCFVCERTFARASVLGAHLRRHTGQRPFQCVLCGRAFASNSNVRRHVSAHKGWPHLAAAPVLAGRLQPPTIRIEDTVCPYCQQTFEDRPERDKHLTAVHENEKRFQCPVRSCRKFFPTLPLILSHLEEMDRNTASVCRCVKDEERLAGKKHTEERVFECPYCRRTFPSLRESGLHQHTHALITAPSAPAPPESAAPPSSSSSSASTAPPTTPKSRGKRRRAGEAGPVLDCACCGGRFGSLEALERHQSQRAASKSGPWRCSVCGKELASPRLLRRHAAGHGEAKLPCPKEGCGRLFASNTQLANHARVHANSSASLKCEICGTSLRRSEDLRRHLASVHTARPSFHCPTPNCSKSFKRLDLLKAHVRRHGTTPTLPCPNKDCNKTFASERTRKVHVESVHQNRFPHSCSICSKGFTRPDALRRHNAKPCAK